ncbi:MAG: RDD family protein [Roseibium sp.]
MSFCTECGSKLPDDAKHCSGCGASVAATTQVSNSQPDNVSEAQAAGSTETAAEPTREPVYIGLGRRFVAHFVDLILVFIMFYVIGLQVAEKTGGLTPDGFDLDGTPALIVIALTFFASTLYFALTEGAGGQSFGKKILGIKVVSADGSPCSFGQAFSRNVLRLIDGIAFYLVGVIFLMRSDTKQRLGDRVAGTVVIRKTKGQEPSSFTYSTRDEQPKVEETEGKVKFRSSWGIKKGRDSWDY